MLKRTVIRTGLTVFFAFIGMVAGVPAALLASTVLPLPGGCMMGQMAFGMLGGSMLGALAGCAIAVPRRGASIPRRVLSFVLGPALAVLGIYALAAFVPDLPPQYDLASLLVLFLLVIPVLSLFGFSIPVLLSRGSIQCAEGEPRADREAGTL